MSDPVVTNIGLDANTVLVLVGIGITTVLALVGATWAIGSKINDTKDDLRNVQGESEKRLRDHMDDSNRRIHERIDAQTNKFVEMDQRISQVDLKTAMLQQKVDQHVSEHQS